MEEEQPQSQSQFPSPPSINGNATSRTSSESTNSPEFEFWMVTNPSGPQTNLLTADELFAGGILLPLKQLQIGNETNNWNQKQMESSAVAVEESTHLSLPTSNLTISKRWTQIFRKNDGKKSDSSTKASGHDQGVGIGKERKREKMSNTNLATAAELNIHIWPFSRSRSAGTGGTRHRGAAPPPRKGSSAPCSRSNSTGEPMSRKLYHSPSKGAGVYLGRSSPVWKVRRGGGSGNRKIPDAGIVNNAEIGNVKTPATAHSDGGVGGGSKNRVLNLNVPMCIGYRHHLSCGSDENSAIAIAIAAEASGGDGGQTGGSGFSEGAGNSPLLSLRNLFTKKVY